MQVLHFSVQRFIFDFENMTRKKSKADVQFPSVIDMGPWIGEGDEGSRQHDISSEQNVYELRGVLLHKGASAYHGHYEAQVYSSDEHKWYQFNDEIVTETDLQPKGSNKKQASSTCTDAAQNGARAFNSRDCYCLIYARRNSEHAGFQLEMPSRDVQARIDALNEDLQGRCDDYNTTLKQQLAEFESLRMEKQRIYNTWQISNIQEPFRIISLRALQLWLQRGFPENISDKTKDDRSALGQEWNREVPLIQCLHGRVDPAFAADIRVVKVASFNALMVSHADLFAQEGMWELCIDCTQLLLRERIYSQDHMKDVEEFRVVEEEDNECVMITDEAFWISKNWLRDWTLSKPKMHIPGLPDPGPEKEPFQSHVYCEHGNLTLSEGSRVRIGPKSLSFIQGLFPEWEPPLTSSESCVLCESYAASDSAMKEEAVAVSVKERESLRILKSMNPLTNGKIVLTGVTYALIPTNWVRSWMSWIGEPRRHSRPADVDNSIFLCSHDLLALDPCDATSLMNTDLSLVTLMQWEKIVAHYPGSGPLITLKRVQDEGLVCEGRGSCRECLLTSDSNKSEDCDVFIHILEKSDDTPTLESHNQVRIAMAANPSMLPSPSTRVMSRRSKRLRGEKGFLRLTCVSATRKSSILLLLCQTSLQEGVRLQDQTFYYEGKEITDESTTLEELSFSSGDLLQLVIERGARSNAMVIELESDDDTLGETSKRRKVPPAEGRAFQGTLLASA
ncbi:hypothetical protein FRC15_004641 [Serendipita sp. 397]|nr:hypothetical protein FRC15_004641 [Serendipita sp. 397]